MTVTEKERFLAARAFMAESEWEMRHEQPKRACETARSWVGIIRLNVMGSSEGYAKGCSSAIYDPPKTMVVPAAPEITLSKMGFDIRFLPAGSEYGCLPEHGPRIKRVFGDVTLSSKGDHSYWNFALPEDCVCITWRMALRSMSHVKSGPEPFNTFFLKPDGVEQETSRLYCRIVAAFATEAEAVAWTETRSAQLRTEHDRNHTLLCDDTGCTHHDST